MMLKKVVLILVVVALVLAIFSVSYNLTDSGPKVVTQSEKVVINGKDISGAKVGVTVDRQVIEDKNE